MSAPTAAGTGRLDPESRAWLAQLHGKGSVREAAIGRLHALLLGEARHEVRRRTAALAHPSGRDLDDLAMQAADDALVAVLGKLDQFRGDALFTTWARRFAALEVPGKIRRRLGHTRETPTGADHWPADPVSCEDPHACIEAVELARILARLITNELTAPQRDVLVALTIDGISTPNLAARLDSTRGALYKTLHDARRKLKHRLADKREGHPKVGFSEPGHSQLPARDQRYEQRDRAVGAQGDGDRIGPRRHPAVGILEQHVLAGPVLHAPARGPNDRSTIAGVRSASVSNGRAPRPARESGLGHDRPGRRAPAHPSHQLSEHDRVVPPRLGSAHILPPAWSWHRPEEPLAVGGR
jgi:RNA polymerase sigma-70 factor, ECF subfamily